MGLKAEAIDYSNAMSHGGTRSVRQRRRGLGGGVGWGGGWGNMPAFFQSVRAVTIDPSAGSFRSRFRDVYFWVLFRFAETENTPKPNQKKGRLLIMLALTT